MSLERLKRTAILRQRERAADRQMAAAVKDSPELQQLIRKCRGLRFYKWAGTVGKTISIKHDSTQFVTWEPTGAHDYKSSCCFNHVIGLPEKGGKIYPLFDYERQLFDALENPGYLNSKPYSNSNHGSKPIGNKQSFEVLYPQKVGHLLLVKSTGIGATEFFIRYLCWKCMVNDELQNTDICIITGPREQLSIDIINRIRKLFLPFNITFDTKETTLFLNGTRIRSFPSNNLSAMRGLPDVSLVYCDEAAFFDKQSQSEVIDVVERYAGKSRAKIILCSTPNKVGDLVHALLQQPFEKSFYKVIKLDYTYSLGKLYTEEDIKIAKASASFEREYNLSFGHSVGNIFSQSSIDRAVELGGRYPTPITINPAASRVCAIDPGFSSSACGFCVLEYSDDIIKTIYAEQFEKPTFNDMITKTFELYTTMKPDNILIDGANPEFIEAVKREIGEDNNWFRIHEKLAQYRNNGWDIMKVMKVVPISFAQEGASMLVHAKQLMEFDEPIVAIHPSFTKLITALRGATAQEYKYDKDSPYADIFDSWRMAMKWFRIRK